MPLQSRAKRLGIVFALTKRMRRFVLLITFTLGLLAVPTLSHMAFAATEGIASLAREDFGFEIYKQEAAGDVRIKDAEAENYLNLARCRCGESIKINAVLLATGRTKLGTAEINAELLWGKDCSKDTASCKTLVAAGKLSSAVTNLPAVATITELFDTFVAGCGPIEDSGSVWLVLKNDTTPLSFTPSKLFRLDTKPPVAPVLLPPTSGEGSITYGWTHPSSADLSGFQALCSPLAGAKSDPGFTKCLGFAEPASVSSIDLCSEKLSNLITSQPLYGFSNGLEYKVGLVAIDTNGNVSEASNLLTATPAPTLDFFEVYRKGGGLAETGCQMGSGSNSRGGLCVLCFAVLFGFLLRRKKLLAKCCSVTTVLVAIFFATSPANAGSFDATDGRVNDNNIDRGESEREFNVSFGVGFYQPQIDKEFQDKGSNARPYNQVFKSDTHSLWQLRLEKILWRKIGTLTLGFGAGHFRVEEKALTATGTQSSDTTALRVIPLSLDLGYQLDVFVDRGWGLMPYARAGFDDAFWYVSDAKSTVAKGSTTGWHAAAGLAFAIDALDPGSARQLDLETGVNHSLVYFEYQHQRLTGLGSKPSLNLSDSMWALGLILQI